MEVLKILIKMISIGLPLRILEGIDGLVIEEEITAITKEIMIDMGDILSSTTTTEVAGKIYCLRYMNAISTVIETHICLNQQISYYNLLSAQC